MAPIFWTQRQDIGPSPRVGHSMVYGQQGLYLFGGQADGTWLDDTWAWDGQLWTQVADTGPMPRSGAAMSTDGPNQQILLFGGAAGGTRFNDTWRWDGASWTQVADTGPTGRDGHAMALDGNRQRIVLFGGETGSGLAGDTWEWVDGNWQQVQDVGPSPRKGHVMAYDAASQRVVMFGGAQASGAGLDDTWSWDGSHWSQVADTGPQARVGSAMVPNGTGLVLFGGIESVDPAIAVGDHVLFGDTWQWAGGQWVQVQDMGPAGRWLHALGFDPASGRVTLFGGASSVGAASNPAGLLRDTWEHAGTAVVGPPPAGILSVAYAQIVAGSPVLAVAGEWLTIGFGLSEPAPAPVYVVTVAAVMTAGGWQQLTAPGLDVPGYVQVNTGEMNGQFDVIRGSDPLDGGQYGIYLYVQDGGGDGVMVEFQLP
jgi:hypothetical protein